MAAQFDPFLDEASLRNFKQLVADLLATPGIGVLGAGASYPLPGWQGLYDDVRNLAGKAAQLLVESFLNLRRAQPGTSLVEIPSWIWSFSMGEGWDFVECRVALGEVFPFIVVSDAERAEAAVARLFQSTTPAVARQAFWGGYCWRNQPHRLTLQVLCRPMREDIVRISKFLNVRHEVRDQLVAHAAIGWVQNIPGYAELPPYALRTGDTYSAERFVWSSGQVLNGADEALQVRFPSLLAEVVDADQHSGSKSGGRGYSSWLRTLAGIGLDERLVPSLRHIFQVLPAKEIYAALAFLKGLSSRDAGTTLELADLYLARTSKEPETRWDARQIFELLDSISDRLPDSPVMSRLVASLLSNDVLSVAEAESLARIG